MAGDRHGGHLLRLLVIGIPVAIAIATSALVFGYIGFGPLLFNLLPARIYGVVTNYTLMAIPLFVFMGVTLQKSQLAEELLDVIGHAFGRLNGGMGIAIILVGVLLGAATGIVGATIVTLGLLTLPALIRRGYSKPLACGTICASGTLGQIIPPSLILILLSDILGKSVGTMFAAAVVPGMLLAGIYMLAFLVLAALKPEMAPAIDADERAAMGRWQLVRKFILVVLPPIGLVVAVLGSIIGGVAAPTEAAAMGAIGAFAIVAVAGKFSFRLFSEIGRSTLLISAMVFCHPHLCPGLRAVVPRPRRRASGRSHVRMGSGGRERQPHLPHAADLRPRLLSGMDRDQLYRAAAVPALLHPERRQSGLARSAHLPQSADLVPDAALRLVAVLSQGRRPTRRDHRRHLSRRPAVHRPADRGAGHPFPVPEPRPVAAGGDRMVKCPC
jgi:hypothetical protein